MRHNLREFDFLRAFAAFSVIAIHILSRRFYISRFAYVLDTCLVYAVPLFLFISGFLLHNSNKDKDNLKYFDFIKKRMSKVFIPYILWTFIYMVYKLDMNFGQVFRLEFLKKYLQSIIHGNGHIHLYFMVIIIQLYLIYPILRKLIVKNPKIVLAASFFISLYFQIEAYMRAHGIRILPIKGQPYYFLFVARWMAYFVLGMYVVHYKEKVQRLLSSMKVEIAIVWVMAAISLVFFSKSLINGSPILNVYVILYACISFFLLYSLALAIKDTRFFIGNYFDWISKQSFFFYLSHLLIMKQFFKLPVIGQLKIWDSDFGLGILFLLIIGLTSVFACAFSRTPFAQLIGVAKFSPKNKVKELSIKFHS